MPEVRILAPTGVIGSGFIESSFERGVSLKPHVIACDAGSTDSGPAFLGTGSPTAPAKAPDGISDSCSWVGGGWASRSSSAPAAPVEATSG